MILLDTHVWVWWIGAPERISAAARDRIQEAMEASGIYISSISSWEVSLLVKKKRLDLTMAPADWVSRSEALPFFHFVPVDNRIFLLSNDLPGDFHDDPADRIITATALTLNLPLVTRDQRILDYPHLETIW